MSRSFNGTSDNITVAVGALTQSYATTGLTIAAILKRTGNAGNIVTVDNAGSTTGVLFEFTDTGGGSMNLSFRGIADREAPAGYVTSAMGWLLVAMTRVGGAGSQVVFPHRYNFGTTTWDHGASLTAVNMTNASPVSTPHIGSDNAGSGSFMGADLAAVAVWDNQLSNLNLESMTATYQSWLDLAPTASWQFNQASVATAIVDNTGNGSDQTAISGTTVGGTEPPGFTYNAAGAQNQIAWTVA